MGMRSLINRILFGWEVWRLKRRMLRASPALREIDKREREARRNHRAVLPIIEERRRLLHARLSREIGTGGH